MKAIVLACHRYLWRLNRERLAALMLGRTEHGPEYHPTNRERSKQPRFGHYWCPGCDANLVSDGERCGRCGRRNRQGRDKGRAR